MNKQLTDTERLMELGEENDELKQHNAKLEKQLAEAEARIEKYELLNIEAENLLKGFDGDALSDELESGE